MMVYSIILKSLILVILAVNNVHSSHNITCQFFLNDGEYVSKLFNQSFKNSDGPTKVFGKHIPGYTNAKVSTLEAFNSSLNNVPVILLRIFQNLKNVYLENTGLEFLTPDSFKYCKNIEHLKFANDAIKIGPGVFRQCVKLDTLEFDSNNLNDIDTDAFQGLSHLRVLRLNNVSLSSVFVLKQLLSSLKRLEEIHLTNNQLKLFPTAALEDLIALKIVNVSYNYISTLSSEYVKTLPQLTLLDLSYNKLSSINRQFLENWQNHSALNLTSNICIDKSYHSIGTDDEPTFKVAADFRNCFEGSTTQEIPSQNDSDENESESKEENKSDSTLNDSQIIQKLSTINALKESKKAVTEAVGNLKKQDSTKDEEKMMGSPFEFMIKDDKSNLEVKKDVIVTEIPADEVVEQNPKMISSEESESEESDTEVEEVLTTTTTTTTTEHPATDEKKKKKKKRKEKNESSTTDMTNSESLSVTSTVTGTAVDKKNEAEITEPSEDVNFKSTLAFDTTIQTNIEKNISSTTVLAEASTQVPESSEMFFHEYEQATCRVYQYADGSYHCVITNATPELKKINLIDSENITKDDISSVFFKNSKLVRVPDIVTIFFPNLKSLSIESTDINTMTHDFFKNCANVKNINVAHNNIRYINSDSLRNCHNLKSIDITGNPIEIIEDGIFKTTQNFIVTFGALKISPPRTSLEKANESKDKNEESKGKQPTDAKNVELLADNGKLTKSKNVQFRDDPIIIESNIGQEEKSLDLNVPEFNKIPNVEKNSQSALKTSAQEEPENERKPENVKSTELNKNESSSGSEEREDSISTENTETKANDDNVLDKVKKLFNSA